MVDIFTKVLGGKQHYYLMNKLGVRDKKNILARESVEREANIVFSSYSVSFLFSLY